MKKTQFLMCMIICLFVTMAIYTVGCNLQNKSKTDKKEITVHDELFRDRDALFERIQSMDDFDAVSYSEKELSSFKGKPEFRDYKQVLKSFVTGKLKKEVDTYQTMDTPEQKKSPFRTIVVTTKDKSVYRVSLKRMDEYNGIWVVDMYGELFWKTYPVADIK